MHLEFITSRILRLRFWSLAITGVTFAPLVIACIPRLTKCVSSIKNLYALGFARGVVDRQNPNAEPRELLVFNATSADSKF
jgi:hypothetical protein